VFAVSFLRCKDNKDCQSFRRCINQVVVHFAKFLADLLTFAMGRGVRKLLYANADESQCLP